MAAYKYNTLASESVDWMSSKGNKLNVTVALLQETSDYFGNGEYTPTTGGLRVSTTCAIDGKEQPGVWIINVSGMGAVVAKIGTIGLTAERVAEIHAATAKVVAHPAYVALMAARAKGEQEAAEYDEHVAAVDNMMTLNGRTF